MNPEYYKYQLESMSFIRAAKVSSDDDASPLPILEPSTCDVTLSPKDAEYILDQVQLFQGKKNKSCRKGLLCLPIFKGIMYDLLVDKVEFNLNLEKSEIEEDDYYSFGRIKNVKKLLNIGEVSVDGLTADNDNFIFAKNALDSIFADAIDNYFVIEQDRLIPANLSGLEKFAFLNQELMCLSIENCLKLARGFFKEWKYYTNQQFIEQLSILILHCPQLQGISNLLAISRLSEYQAQNFIDRYCKKSHDYETINSLSLNDILKPGVDELSTPPTSSTTSGILETKTFKIPNDSSSNNNATGSFAENVKYNSTSTDRKRRLNSNDDEHTISKKIKFDKKVESKTPSPSLYNTDRQLTPDTYSTSVTSLTPKNSPARTTGNNGTNTYSRDYCDVGENIHIKIVGPINGAFITFLVDQESGYVNYSMNQEPSNSPDGAIESIKFIQSHLAEFGATVKHIIYSDIMFDKCKPFLEYLKALGIKKHLRRGSDAFVLRTIRSILNRCRQYLDGANVPLRFWNTALAHAVFLFNQESSPEISPPIARFEIFYPVRRIRLPFESLPFGCGIIVGGKYQAKGVFLGYSHKANLAFYLPEGDYKSHRTPKFTAQTDVFPLIDYPELFSNIDYAYTYSDFTLLLDPDLIDAKYMFDTPLRLK